MTEQSRWELYEMWLKLAWRRCRGTRGYERATMYAEMYRP